MFSLRLQGGIPLSEQLEARIAELIIGGEMAENEKLPAVREVAKALTINPNTVQKTDSLNREGLYIRFPERAVMWLSGRNIPLRCLKRQRRSFARLLRTV